MEKFTLFILHPEEKLAAKIASNFPNQIADCSITTFKDGEINFENNTSIRNERCFIIQSIFGNYNDRLMEMLIAIDALKRASAQEVNVVIPYLFYSRQDRKAKPRQAISASMLAKILETAGANRIVTLDLHAPQIEGFYSIPVDNIPCAPLFIKFFQSKIKPNTVIIAPDHGSVSRTGKVAERMNLPLAIIDKRRRKANEVESMTIMGEIEGKHCVIIDDMVDTAGTLCLAAALLKEKGAASVSAFCTHAVLSGNAIERIENSAIDDFYVTNSISKAHYFDDEHVLDLSTVLTKVIHCIDEGEAVTEIIERLDS